MAFAMILATVSCSGKAPLQPTIDPTQMFQNALLTATYGVPTLTETPTPQPTATPIPPTPTVPRTPPALPSTYISSALNPLDVPHTYISDTCQYLKARWDPNNSAPGTAVMVVMFHSIVAGVADPAKIQVSQDTVTQLLKSLKDQGFQTINAQQLSDFLHFNTKIPNRSVLLLVDDRHYAEYFEVFFKPQLLEYGWTMTNAFISHPETSEDLWQQNARLQAEGWLDHQAHGVDHNVMVDPAWTPDTPLNVDIYGDLTARDFIRREMEGSVTAIEQRFGKRPVAYIWPGGSFSQMAVDIALETGYQIGLTVNPRGPVMYNWIPLADEADPARPSYIAEGKISNPLMVLPRYWDADAINYVDTVRVLGKEAAAQAEQNRATELEYYDIVCSPVLGPIPTAQP